MSHQNPLIESPPTQDPHLAIQPTAPDFVETPDVPPLSTEREALPVWLYLVCGLALFLAGSSFTGLEVFGAKQLDQGPGGPVTSESAAVAEAPATPMDLGKAVYGGNCANCHLGTGEGQPGKYPPLAGSEWVLGSKQRLAAILLKGLEGPVTVRGASFGTQVMPAQESILTPEKIANLMTYLRGSWGNTGGAVTPDEVTAAKAKFAPQSAAYTEADLLKIAPHGPDPSDKK
jgi:mono/diheme cytochrome c family protein